MRGAHRDIFERVVRTWWTSEKLRDQMLQYNQLATWGLGQGGPPEASRVARALGRIEYHAYFDYVERRGLTARWDVIREDFPTLCGEPVQADDTLRQMLTAVNDERRAAARQRLGGRQLQVHALEKPDTSVGTNLWLVRYTIGAQGSDDEPPFDEGDKVAVVGPDGERLPAEVGGLLEGSGRLLLFVTAAVRAQLPFHGIVRENLDVLLQRLARRIEACLSDPAPRAGQLALLDPGGAWKRRVDPPVTPAEVVDSTALNEDQKAAVLHAGNHALSAIWGPPGTGKTHTLARLVLSLALRGERVLVIAPSNIALDQIALRLLQIAETHADAGALVSAHRVLRFGFPKLAEVASNDALYPDLKEVRALNDQIRRVMEAVAALTKVLDNDPDNDEVREPLAMKTREVRELSDDRRKLLDEHVNQAQVVLTTAAMCATDDTLHAGEPFESVVFDEASMLSPVLALPAAALATQRMVVVGDFQQLPPIVLAVTEAADRWLRRDLFDHLELVDTTKEGRRRLTPAAHHRVRMLRTQHRMHPDIADVSNRLFYDGQLRTARHPRPLPAAFHDVPRAIVLNLDGNYAGWVRFTKAGSRVNPEAAKVTLALVGALRDLSDLSIAVIAPYRAHIHRLRKGVSAIDPAIRVGTIHTMQGSEADIVVWDLVDVADSERGVRAGMLYRGLDGNRLFNVAATRARELLVIVGHVPSFTDTRSGVQSLATAMNNLYGRLSVDELKNGAWLRW